MLVYPTTKAVFTGLKLTLILLICLGINSLVATPSDSQSYDYRKRPEVVEWTDRAGKAQDKVEVWIKAAQEGNMYVKWVAAEKLGLLGNPKAIPVLKKLEAEPFDDDGYSPCYQHQAKVAIERIEASQYWQQNVESKANKTEKVEACRSALSYSNEHVRRDAFRYLLENAQPQMLVDDIVTAFAKNQDYYLLSRALTITSQHQSEDWVIQALNNIKDLKLNRQMDMDHAISAACYGQLRQLGGQKRWNETFKKAKTKEEKKKIALDTLREGPNETLQRLAVDYLITLDDKDLIPVWIKGITVDARIRQKLVKMGRDIVPDLINNLSDRTNEDRVCAAMEILAEIGDERAIKPLESMMLEPLDPDGMVGSIRGSAEYMLIKFGKAAIPGFTRVLKSNDALAVAAAAEGLANVGGQAELKLLEARLAEEKRKPKPDESVLSGVKDGIEMLRKKNAAGNGVRK